MKAARIATMISNDIEYHYVWAGELKTGTIRVLVEESAKEAHVNLLVVRDLSKVFRALGKVVCYHSTQITLDWAVQSFLSSSRRDITVQAWGPSFEVQVYDAL